MVAAWKLSATSYARRKVQDTPTAGFFFITILSKMSCNKNENSLPVNNSSGQTELVHDTDKKFNYSEMLQNCKISKNTANFIACKMALFDLFDQTFNAVVEMFGKIRADEIMEGEYLKKSRKLEEVLDGFINDSIYENICNTEFYEI